MHDAARREGDEAGDDESVEEQPSMVILCPVMMPMRAITMP
jgi:hypothetical protein